MNETYACEGFDKVANLHDVTTSVTDGHMLPVNDNCTEIDINSVMLTDSVMLEQLYSDVQYANDCVAAYESAQCRPTELSNSYSDVSAADAECGQMNLDMPTCSHFRKRKNAAPLHTSSKKSVINLSNGTVSVDSLQQSLQAAKPPLPSKCRGRPKGVKKFRCSGATVSSASRESVLKNVMRDGVSVEEIMQCSKLLTVDDIKEHLQPAILQFSWTRYKQFFTEPSFAFLTSQLETLRTLVNTCPVCSVTYDGNADMVGCDSCGRWFHFCCVGLRRAPPGKRDWYCNDCKGQYNNGQK